MSAVLWRLKSSMSVIDKKNVLAKLTELEKTMFYFAYNPYLMFKQKFSNISYNFLGEPSQEMFILLQDVADGRMTGNNARAAIESFANEHGNLILLICNKDLDCGVTATTLNQVFPGLVPEFNIQLAKEVESDKIVFPIAGQLKYNGARVITLIDINGARFYSRGGHEFHFPKLKQAIERKLGALTTHIAISGLMLDGELTFGDSRNEDHTKVSGIVNSSIKGTPIHSSYDLQYNIFDCMSLYEFENNRCDFSYKKRYKDLELIINIVNSDLVVLAETYEFNSLEELNNKFSRLLASGYEGLILKSWGHKYTFKKNANWIKMKATETADLICSSFEEGQGKYEGMIGALHCCGFVEGKFVSVDVGSGLTDLDRAQDPNKYLSHVIEVKYNKVILDTKTLTYSLFLPRFVCVRNDK